MRQRKDIFMNVIYTLKENGIQVEEKTAFLKRQKNKTISLDGLTKVYVSFNKPSGKLAVFTLFFGRKKIHSARESTLYRFI